MLSKKVISSIHRIVSHLIELGLVSDQNFSGCKTMQSGDIIVSVSEDPGLSFLHCKSYSDLYYEVERRNAFDLKFLDGALVSMSYIFRNDETLKLHRLAFFPSPQLPQFQDLLDDYIGDTPFIENIGTQAHPSPLRFDFDADNAQPISHPASHLTIGQYANCRIPVSAPLEPVEFTTFIVRNFYDSAILEQGSRPCPKPLGLFSATLAPEESNMPHLRLRS